MSELKAKTRNKMPDRDFGLSEQRKYPMEDKAHARDAKSRASAAEHEGHITRSQEERIDHKADRKLGIKEHQKPEWK